MITIKFIQDNTTWSEEVEATYSSVYAVFMSLANPQNQPSIIYEVFDDDTFYNKGEFPLFCNEDEESEFWLAQDEKIQEIIDEIEKRSMI